jgi:hypothetical protein
VRHSLLRHLLVLKRRARRVHWLGPQAQQRLRWQTRQIYFATTMQHQMPQSNQPLPMSKRAIFLP